MEKVKVTMELTPKEFMRLADYLQDPHEEKAKKPAKTKKSVAPVVDEPLAIDEGAEPEAKEMKVTKEEIRALGVKMTEQGRAKDLKEIFGKYGAKKLQEIAEDNYTGLYWDLKGALDG